jgi:hypothetical protein
MAMLNDKEYQCDLCKKVFYLVRDETWSNDKAENEYKNNFTGDSMSDRNIVCDDCYKSIVPWAESQ